MKLLVTGATGFLGWRAAVLLARGGPRGRGGVAAGQPLAGRVARTWTPCASTPATRPSRDLVAGCDAVLHFAGVPDPAGARRDPARAVRENAGTTLNLLEGCAEHGAGLIYPSSVRAAQDPPPDPYAMSKRLGENACRFHPARPPSCASRRCSAPGRSRGRAPPARSPRSPRGRSRASRS